MMLKKLKECLTNEIFDIIVYGSSVKGKRKPKDIDVIVIFNEKNLKKRLNSLQSIKKTIKDNNVDFKQMILEDLFSPAFLARTGILLEGSSVRKNKPFAETLGFKAFSLFTYNLSTLNHSQKVKFNYILAGRNKKGVIEELEGSRLVNGAIKIPIKNSLTFEEILKNNGVEYIKKNILEEV